MCPHWFHTHPGLAALLVTAVAALGVLALVALVARRLAPATRRVRTSRRQIALTFDDGPSEATPAVLALLAKHRVQATFFVCGKNVKRLPEVARAIVEAGHELGNHTHHHLPPGPRQKLATAAALHHEMRKAQTCIHHYTGVWPRYFRAPGAGWWWFGLRKAQRRLGVRGVGWSVAVQEGAEADRTIAHLLHSARPGSIVRLHDGSGLSSDPDLRGTLEALDRVLPTWKARGFRVGTVHELMRKSMRHGRAARRTLGGGAANACLQ